MIMNLFLFFLEDTTGCTERERLENALETYRDTLVPLHYHELWQEVRSGYLLIGQDIRYRIQANAQCFYPRKTLIGDDDTCLMFTTIRTNFGKLMMVLTKYFDFKIYFLVDSYADLHRRISLFDLVLVQVDNQQYFGVSVHVEHNKVKTEANSHQLQSTDTEDRNNLHVELLTTYGIYISKECADAVQALPETSKGRVVQLQKISNVTSSRRMISAINNLSYWPQHHSLLKPTEDDAYFQLPENFDEANDECFLPLNEAQSRVVRIAESMADDIQDRFHLIHGPPGK